MTSIYLGHKEAFRKQHNFTNLLQVRDNDHHWPEEGFDRLWQLGAPCVTRVHRDEDAHSVIQIDLLALKLFFTTCNYM